MSVTAKVHRGDLTHRTLNGLLWAAWGKIAHGVLQLAIVAVLARLLAPADFGVASAALVVIGLSSIVSQLGLGSALVQRPKLEDRHTDSSFIASVALGLALGGLVWIAAPYAATFFRIAEVEPVLRALATVFPLQGVSVVAESLAKRELRFRWLANVDVVSYGLGYGLVAIALAAYGLGVWSLVWGEIAKTVFRDVLLLADRRPQLRRLPDSRALKELLYLGGGFTLGRIANYLALHGDALVVGRTLGSVALGLYGRAYQLMTAPAIALGGILDNVLFPAMARVQGDPARLAAAYRRGVSLLAVTMLPFSVAVFVLAPEIIRVLLGPKWTGAVVPFQILTVGMTFRTSYKMSDSLARATGAVYRRAWRQIVYAMLVMAGALIGQRWGLAGVAGGVVIAVSVNFALMAQLSLSVVPVTWGQFARTHLPAAALGMAVAPVLWGAAQLGRQVGLPAVAVLMSAGVPAVIVAALLMKLAPRIFVGEEAAWAARTLRSALSHRGASSPISADTAPLSLTPNQPAPLESVAPMRQTT
jgi:O-antigen/teichoic acid export membrane protein